MEYTQEDIKDILKTTLGENLYTLYCKCSGTKTQPLIEEYLDNKLSIDEVSLLSSQLQQILNITINSRITINGILIDFLSKNLGESHLATTFTETIINCSDDLLIEYTEFSKQFIKNVGVLIDSQFFEVYNYYVKNEKYQDGHILANKIKAHKVINLNDDGKSVVISHIKGFYTVKFSTKVNNLGKSNITTIRDLKIGNSVKKYLALL